MIDPVPAGTPILQDLYQPPQTPIVTPGIAVAAPVGPAAGT